MAAVGPLAAGTEVDDLLELHPHHFGVGVARVQQDQSEAVYDVPVGLAVEERDYAAFLAVEVVEGGLRGGVRTVGCVAM